MDDELKYLDEVFNRDGFDAIDSLYDKGLFGGYIDDLVRFGLEEKFNKLHDLHVASNRNLNLDLSTVRRMGFNVKRKNKIIGIYFDKTKIYYDLNKFEWY